MVSLFFFLFNNILFSFRKLSFESSSYGYLVTKNLCGLQYLHLICVQVKDTVLPEAMNAFLKQTTLVDTYSVTPPLDIFTSVVQNTFFFVTG